MTYFNKKIKNVRDFTIILSLGTILNFLGSIPFRLIALNVLGGNEYSIFALTVQTFSLLIPIGKLNLNSPFIRELKLTKRYKNIRQNFALSYLIMSVISFILMLIIGYFFLKISIFYLFFLSTSLFFYCFSEYFLSIARAKALAIKSMAISCTSGVFEAIIIIPFCFNIKGLLELDSFIFLYCFSFIIPFLMGLFLIKLNWKSLFEPKQFFSKKKFTEAIKNIKKGALLSGQTLFDSLVSWLLIFLAIQVLDPNTFKIFDLCFYMISFFSIFSTNLLISILSTSEASAGNSNDLKKLRKIFYLLILAIVIVLVFFLLLNFLPIEPLLETIFNIYLSGEGKNLITISIFIPFFLFFFQFLNGKIQVLGKYQEVLFGSFLSFLGSLFFLILGFYLNSAIILILGYIAYNSFKTISFYLFIS